MELDTRPLTVGDWMLTLLVLAIPLVNIAMYLFWAISDSGNINRKRFCQASLIWFLIIFGVSFGAAILLGGLGMMGAML